MLHGVDDASINRTEVKQLALHPEKLYQTTATRSKFDNSVQFSGCTHQGQMLSLKIATDLNIPANYPTIELRVQTILAFIKSA